MSVIYRLVDVCLTYAAHPPVHAVRNCTLDIHRGEFVAICGTSGSGKSSLLNLLGLIDRPTSGEIYFRDTAVAALKDHQLTVLRRHSIGFVFQAFHLIPHRTVVDNVCLPMVYAGVPRRERRARALDALRTVGLLDRAWAQPQTLSGGEAQRVAIARALVTAPDVILCDEPTGNLDSANAANVIDALRALNNDNQTIVLVTHDQNIARAARRIVRVRDGVVSETTHPDAA